MLGQRDVERDGLVEDSFFVEEPMPLDVISNVIHSSCCTSFISMNFKFTAEESECFYSSTKRPRLENCRLSTVDRPGTSGAQYNDTQADFTENEDSQEEIRGSAEEQEQPTPPRSFKRM